MIPFAALVVALACALASARRVWLAANPIAFHPEVLADALAKKKIDKAAFRAMAKADPAADWERDLFEALDNPNEQARVALVNEQLT